MLELLLLLDKSRAIWMRGQS